MAPTGVLWLVALSLGLGIGAGVGCLLELPRLPPLVRSVSAGLLGMAAAAAAMGGTWYLELRRYQNVGIHVGLEESAPGRSALLLAGLAAAFALLHAIVVRVGRARPALVRHASVVVGCAGGLVGTLPLAWAMVVLRSFLQP
jgi:hypothetical protein